MALWLKANGLNYVNVFADTGWEHDITYEYLDKVLPGFIGPIHRVQSKTGGMRDVVLKKGMFPSRLRRFCTEELKVTPIQKYIAARQDEGNEVVNVVGIRAGESDARSKMPEWEWSDKMDCWVWRPLLNWTEQNVIDMHKEAGLAPNPLYLKGATRVGCWPCIFARKAEVRFVAESDPARVELIRQLEADVLEAAKKRYAARGESLESLEYGPPTFFHGRGHRDARSVPIDVAISWSKQGRNSVSLLDEGGRDGCVRWGLCETEPEAAED